MESSKGESPGADPAEAIIGEVPVAAKLAMGIEHLRLILTTRRLIVVHVGKRGAGALASVSLLGRFSEALEALARGGKESMKKRTIKFLSVDEILQADKDNFQVNYEDVVRTELYGSSSGLRIMILTKEDKLQFTTARDPRSVEHLLRKAMGSKVTGNSAG